MKPQESSSVLAGGYSVSSSSSGNHTRVVFLRLQSSIHRGKRTKDSRRSYRSPSHIHQRDNIRYLHFLSRSSCNICRCNRHRTNWSSLDKSNFQSTFFLWADKVCEGENPAHESFGYYFLKDRCDITCVQSHFPDAHIDVRHNRWHELGNSWTNPSSFWKQLDIKSRQPILTFF